MKSIIAKKVGMTNVFDANGAAIPVTVLQAGPCVVTQVKKADKDGYEAVQLGFGDAKKQPKSRAGHLKVSKANSNHLKEYRNFEEEIKVGDMIDVSGFNEGDIVTVRANSKGKGFAGTIKRHNFSQGPKTHGSRNYRRPGSIGAGYPQHVFAGQKMAGRMGNVQTTVKNLPIMKIDKDSNLIAVKGAVPGPKRGIVSVEVIKQANSEGADE